LNNRHVALRGEVFSLATAAGLSVALEVGDGEGKRRPGDVYIKNDPPTFVDVAVIHPLATHLITRDQRSREPAPDFYARTIKDAKYKRPLSDAGLLFIPFVADVYGNLCEDASLLLKKLAKSRAIRDNTSPSKAVRLAQIHMSFVIAHAVAKMLVPSDINPAPPAPGGPSTRWYEADDGSREDAFPAEDDDEDDAVVTAVGVVPPPAGVVAVEPQVMLCR
jgi:hypothetical protein